MKPVSGIAEVVAFAPPTKVPVVQQKLAVLDSPAKVIVYYSGLTKEMANALEPFSRAFEFFSGLRNGEPERKNRRVSITLDDLRQANIVLNRYHTGVKNEEG